MFDLPQYNRTDNSPYYSRSIAEHTSICAALGGELILGITTMSTGNFSPIYSVMSMIILSNLYPIDEPTNLSLDQVHFLFDLVRGVPIDLGWHIYNVWWSMAEEGSQSQFLPFTSLITCLCKYKFVPPQENCRSIPLSDPISLNTLNNLNEKARNARIARDPFDDPPTCTPAFHYVNMQTLSMESSQKMATSFSLIHDHLDHISSRMDSMDAHLPPPPSPPAED